MRGVRAPPIDGEIGRRVIALTEDTAAVETSSGAALIYRKHRKPAFGPMGDSLDDFIA